MTAVRLYIAALALMTAPQYAVAFKPDLIRGCKVIAQAQKNPSTADSIHAAYCLGVLDGIFTAISKQQSAVSLPDPCFSKTLIPPSELAAQVVRVLTEQPKITELANTVANDRGAMAAYFALAVTNKCDAGRKAGK